MARDSQAALVALNRFGFGARGGASGDFVNAASDPRGFVKAELNRPNGVLLEVPGLLSTPAYGQAVFAYQAEVKQARDAFLDAVGVPLLSGQVGVFGVERREGAFRAPFRLGAGLELHGNGDGEAHAVGPERSFRVRGC